MPISASPTLPVKKIPVHIKSAQNSLLIKGGRVVNHDQSYIADVYIEDGIIKDVGENLIVPGGIKTIDAKGKLVIPGGIDTHTHFESYHMGTRTADDYYTGTKAALAGGTTTIMNMIIPENKTASLIEAFNLNKERAEKKACCDYSFHICLPAYNDKVAKEMEAITRERGINSFKMCCNADLIKAVKKCKELGAIAMLHPEDDALIDECTQKIKAYGITGPEGHLLSRPEQCEAETAQRAITIAEEINCPLYIVDVMSKSTALTISNARRHNAIVYGEPIAASLGTDGTHYFNKCWKHSAAHVMSPPLRDDPTTPAYLMDMLCNGDLELTGSDHCTYNVSQKALGKDDFTKIPGGVNGVEERMSIVWDRGVRTGKIDPCRFVAVTSTNAAKLFNMYPRKGYIGKGSDADVVVWDPEQVKTVSCRAQNMACDFNIFENMSCYGAACSVVCGGRVVLEDGGALSVVQGAGKFVERPCFADYVYSRIKVKDSLRPKRVEREPYIGDVVDITKEMEKMLSPKPAVESPSGMSSSNAFHNRPLTKAGGRNLQDSQFTIGGDWDEQTVTSTRVKNPPGGKSSVIF